MEGVNEVLDYADAHKIYPDLRVIASAVEPELLIEGRKVLMFSSNNYLGLATHQKLKDAAINATNKYGTGSTGSRLLSGNIDVHEQLETELARFKGGEDAIVFSSGFSTNVSVISAIANPLRVHALSFFRRKTIVLSDELNHASIIDGINQSKQCIAIYRHKDINDLERLLKKYVHRRKLIVTDSVFSMDGDIAPLDIIVKLAKKYGAFVMIDEAHGTGVFGEKGTGVLERYRLRVPEDVQIVMGTLSKAMGSSGGYVVGSKNLVKYLRVAARSYMFSTAMPPSASAVAIAALEVVSSSEGKELRNKLFENVKYLKEGFLKLGFNIMGSESQIIPIFIGSDQAAIKASRLFFEKNIFAPCVRWPAVSKGKARIRFTITAAHTKEQIDYLLETNKFIKEKLKL